MTMEDRKLIIEALMHLSRGEASFGSRLEKDIFRKSAELLKQDAVLLTKVDALMDKLALVAGE